MYYLLTVPDNNSPVLEKFVDPYELAYGLKSQVAKASRAYALEDYSFYAFVGEELTIHIDEDSADVVVSCKGKTFRPQVSSKETLVKLIDGRLSSGEEKPVASSNSNSSSDSWGVDFDFS